MLRYWTESYWWSIVEIRERGKIICPRRFFSRNIKTWYRITYNCAYSHTVKVHPRSHYLSVRLLNFASNILILLSNFPGILSWKLLVLYQEDEDSLNASCTSRNWAHDDTDDNQSRYPGNSPDRLYTSLDIWNRKNSLTLLWKITDFGKKNSMRV